MKIIFRYECRFEKLIGTVLISLWVNFLFAKNLLLKVQITLFKALIQSVAAVGFNRAASRYLNQYQECVQGLIDDDDLT